MNNNYITLPININFLNNYIIFSFLLIFLSFLILIFNYDNIIIIFFSIEIMFFGCILNFIVFSLFSLDYSGFIYVLMILVISVSELCIGLAIVVRLSKFKSNLKNSYLNKMNF